jgi:hypothetical protein
VHVHRGTLGIADALVGGERGLLALAGQRDRLLHVEQPGVIEIEIGEARGQHLLVGQPGAIIARGVARDVERGIYRVVHRLPREIRGARVAAALAEVDGDAEPLVAVVFDGLHRALAHGDRLAEAFRHFRRAGAGALLIRITDDVVGDLVQRVGGKREAVCGLCDLHVRKFSKTDCGKALS